MKLRKIHLNALNLLAKEFSDEFADNDNELGSGDYQLGTSEVITNYLRDKFLYIENGYLYFNYAYMSDWVFITQLVEESFDGSLADTNIYKDVLCLSGDDDSDYNNAYIHAFIDTIKYLVEKGQ